MLWLEVQKYFLDLARIDLGSPRMLPKRSSNKLINCAALKKLTCCLLRHFSSCDLVAFWELGDKVTWSSFLDGKAIKLQSKARGVFWHHGNVDQESYCSFSVDMPRRSLEKKVSQCWQRRNCGSHRQGSFFRSSSSIYQEKNLLKSSTLFMLSSAAVEVRCVQGHLCILLKQSIEGINVINKNELYNRLKEWLCRQGAIKALSPWTMLWEYIVWRI